MVAPGSASLFEPINKCLAQLTERLKYRACITDKFSMKNMVGGLMKKLIMPSLLIIMLGALAHAQSYPQKNIKLKDLSSERSIDSVQVESELAPEGSESSKKDEYFRTPASERIIDQDVSSLRNQYNIMRDQSNLIQSW